MKTIIYKELGKYRATNEANYNAFVRNDRQVQKLDDFENAQEIIEYYCKYFNCSVDDFIIMEG